MEPSQKNEALSYLQYYGDSDSDSEVNHGNPAPADEKVVIEDFEDNENNNRASGGPSTSKDSNNVVGDSQEESEKMDAFVRMNNIINARSHGPVPSVVSYTRDGKDNTERNNMIIQDGEELMDCHHADYRDGLAKSWSDDDSSSSDMESVKELECFSDSWDEDEGATGGGVPGTKKVAVKAKGEFDIDDLPPIEDLRISVAEQQCTEIGKIFNIVTQIVVVQSLPNLPSLNIDTVLFLEKGARALGQIFDVFGQVTEPYYCVRFNSSDHIKEKGIELGMSVYCAPKTDHTKYIFVSELMKLKGTDASWVNDDEPPPQFLDFSDDEAEREARKERRKKPRTDGRGAGRGAGSFGGRGTGRGFFSHAPSPFSPDSLSRRGPGRGFFTHPPRSPFPTDSFWCRGTGPVALRGVPDFPSGRGSSVPWRSRGWGRSPSAFPSRPFSPS